MFGFNRSIPKFCNLTGKVAVVTGAGKGIGKDIAIRFALAGAKVVLADISLQECQQVVEEIKKNKGDALALKCDISKKTEVDDLIKETLAKFHRIDILVNNAGIYPFEPFLQMSEQNFEKVIDVNLKGSFLMSQACAKEMSKAKSGSIVNIASVAMGQIGMGFAGLTHYCASKGGMVGMAEAMSLELAPTGIRVNTIAPGAIDTPGASSIKMDAKALEAMLAPIPMKRKGTGMEIANAALFLASEESSYMTGSVVVVDGGWCAN